MAYSHCTALISGHHDVASACNFELASSSQIISDSIVKWSDVMGSLETMQRERGRWINIRVEDTNDSARCRNECIQWYLCRERDWHNRKQWALSRIRRNTSTWYYTFYWSLYWSRRQSWWAWIRHKHVRVHLHVTSTSMLQQLWDDASDSVLIEN